MQAKISISLKYLKINKLIRNYLKIYPILQPYILLKYIPWIFYTYNIFSDNNHIWKTIVLAKLEDNNYHDHDTNFLWTSY